MKDWGPKDWKAGGTVLLAAGAAVLAGWFVWQVIQLLNAAKAGVVQGVDSATSAIAHAIVGDSTMKTSFSFVLASGTRIPGDQVRIINPDIPTFTYKGVTYKVTGRRADNDYDAVAA